jgi:hypothetical protein
LPDLVCSPLGLVAVTDHELEALHADKTLDRRRSNLYRRSSGVSFLPCCWGLVRLKPAPRIRRVFSIAHPQHFRHTSVGLRAPSVVDHEPASAMPSIPKSQRCPR